jgi:hypothetical protein
VNPDDPTPLARQDADPLVHALLRAGQRERAPKGSEERVLAVLGVGGAAGGAAALASVAKLAARLGPKGMLMSGVIAAAVIGVGVWTFFDASRHAPPLVAPAPVAPSPIAPPLAATSPGAPSIAAPEPAAPNVPVTRIEDLPSSQASGAASAKATPSPRTAPPGELGPSLAREVELVEAARAALARGDASAALRSLDTYDREIPAGTLSPESRVLRIEALVRSGSDANRVRANALGDAFLAANPNGPQARRVRSVLQRAP